MAQELQAVNFPSTQNSLKQLAVSGETPLEQVGNRILAGAGVEPCQWKRAYQYEGDKEVWKYDTLRKVDATPDAMYKTVLATNYTGPDGTVSKDDAVYIGEYVYFDFDGENIKTVIEAVNRFAKKFEDQGVDPNGFKWWASGGKGFHCFVPLDVFVQGGVEGLKYAELRCLPYIFREIAERLYVDTLDTRVYSMGKGRMWRQENIQRPNGKYKVPVLYTEIQGMTPEAYELAVSTPRLDFQAPTPTLMPAPPLSAIWIKVSDKTCKAYRARVAKKSAPAPYVDEVYRDRMQSLLAVIDPDGGDYQDWFNGVAAIHDYYDGSDEGYQVANEWSKQGKKYDEASFDATWHGLMCGTSSAITIATLIKYVRDNAIEWQDPAPTLNPKHNPVINPDGATPRELTEVCLAQFLADKYRERLLYVPEHEVWKVWDDKVWVEEGKTLPIISKLVVDEGSQIRDLMLSRLEDVDQVGDDISVKKREKRTSEALRFFSGCIGTERGISSLIRCMQRWVDAKDPESFDGHPYLINTQNGIVDLRTRELMPHDPKYLFTKITKVEYQPAKGCPKFLEFIDGINKVGAEWGDYLLDQVSYALTGDISLTRSHWWVGGGANGKSTLTNVLTHVMGSFAHTVNINTFMRSRDHGVGSATPELDNLRGVRMLFSTEMTKGSQLDEGAFKSLISTDPIPSRRLYASKVDQIRPVFKFFPFFNDMPIIAGTDNGTWRRIAKMDFLADFAGADRDKRVMGLEDTLKKEDEGIFALLVDRCHDLLRTSKQDDGSYRINLPIPECVQGATGNYRESLDPVAEFIMSHLIKDEDLVSKGAGGFIPNVVMSIAFEYYRATNGKPKMSGVTLRDELKKHLHHTRATSGMVYRGARVNVESFPEDYFKDRIASKFIHDKDVFADRRLIRDLGGLIGDMSYPKLEEAA